MDNFNAALVLAYVLIVVAFAYAQPTQMRTRTALGFGVGVLVVLGFLSFFRELLVPFLVPLLMAYLLDPLLDWMTHHGWGRTRAIIAVFIVVIGALVIGALVVVPTVVTQTRDGVTRLTSVDWANVTSPDNLEQRLRGWVDKVPGNKNAVWKTRLKATISDNKDVWRTQQDQIEPQLKKAGAWLAQQVQSLLAWAFSTVAALAWVLLLPLTLWYCLTDYDKLQKRLWYIVPPESRLVVGSLSSSVNRAMGNYLRGYALLCLGVGLSQTTILMILTGFFHFKYALVIGIISGCTYFIPYVGSLTSVALGVLAIYFTGEPALSFVHALIGLVFLQGSNTIWDSFINPKVIGDKTGIHPMMVMFALLAGGKLLGLTGVIISTPMLVCVKIVLEHFFPRLSEPIPASDLPEHDLPQLDDPHPSDLPVEDEPAPDLNPEYDAAADAAGAEAAIFDPTRRHLASETPPDDMGS